jgi:hypothetical protein
MEALIIVYHGLVFGVVDMDTGFWDSAPLSAEIAEFNQVGYLTLDHDFKFEPHSPTKMHTERVRQRCTLRGSDTPVRHAPFPC